MRETVQPIAVGALGAVAKSLETTLKHHDIRERSTPFRL